VNPPPAQHWVFIDEHPDSINDGNFIVTISSSPSQTRIVDYPAAWHDRGAGLAFADGRAEIHRWLDARTMPAPRYDGSLALNVASPNNPDVAWLAARTSARAP
jgi:prepilin-type processing-associated H-X9-DG protein